LNWSYKGGCIEATTNRIVLKEAMNPFRKILSNHYQLSNACYVNIFPDRTNTLPSLRVICPLDNIRDDTISTLYLTLSPLTHKSSNFDINSLAIFIRKTLLKVWRFLNPTPTTFAYKELPNKWYAIPFLGPYHSKWTYVGFAQENHKAL